MLSKVWKFKMAKSRFTRTVEVFCVWKYKFRSLTNIWNGKLWSSQLLAGKIRRALICFLSCSGKCGPNSYFFSVKSGCNKSQLSVLSGTKWWNCSIFYPHVLQKNINLCSVKFCKGFRKNHVLQRWWECCKGLWEQ